MCSYDCPINPPSIPSLANPKITLLALVHRFLFFNYFEFFLFLIFGQIGEF